MRDLMSARGAAADAGAAEAPPLDYVTAWWSVLAPLVGVPSPAREFAAG